MTNPGAHTDSAGRDLEPPDTVRIYLWASSQHFADPNTMRPSRGNCQRYGNVVQTSMFLRAMLDALDAWATHGTEPPASRIARQTDETLVEYEAWRSRFPRIPGVITPCGANSLLLNDFGLGFERGLLTKEPPDVAHVEDYAVLVPAVDADGNDVAGVRAPMVRPRSAPARAGSCAPADSVMAPCTSSPGVTSRFRTPTPRRR